MSTSTDLVNGGSELRGRKLANPKDEEVNGGRSNLDTSKTKERSEKGQGTWGRTPDGTGNFSLLSYFFHFKLIF